MKLHYIGKKERNKFFLKIFVALFATCYANAQASNWITSGNYSISWFKKDLNEFEITSNKELAGLSFIVTNGYSDFSGVVIKLTKDINLSGHIWSTIGKDANSFKGTFDGQGHSITGIEINLESGDSKNYAFFGSLTDARIQNVIFRGKINIEESTAGNCEQYIGSIAAQLNNTLLEHCHSYIDITYNRLKTNTTKYKIYVGGLAAKSTKSNIIYCINQGNLSCTIGSRFQEYYDSLHETVGGISGESTSCNYVGCENSSSHIKVQIYGSENSSSTITIGGIVGNITSDNFKYCKSTCNFTATSSGKTYKNVYVGGIAGYSNSAKSIINCFSCIKIMTINGKVLNLYYGGIVGKTIAPINNLIANYSNSDLCLNITGEAMSNIIGEHGSTSYSTSEMGNKTFLEELNFYSQLNEGTPIWVNGLDIFPSISYLSIPTRVEKVKNEKNETKESALYLLSGYPSKRFGKGLNIINRKKIYVK